MKVAVINFSGNVGKSTVARHLLQPRMHNCEIFSIETINADDHEGEQVKGKEYANIIAAMTMMDDAIVDIGASNVEELVLQMKQYKGSHEDFDYFVIPTTPLKKHQRDTVSTIEALNEIGVPVKKIRLLFNMVEPGEKVENVFPGLFDLHEAEKSFTLNPKAVLYMCDIYGKLSGTDMTIAGALADTTDFRAQITAARQAKNIDEAMRLSGLLAIQRLSAGVIGQLDSAFKALVK